MVCGHGMIGSSNDNDNVVRKDSVAHVDIKDEIWHGCW